VTGALDGKADGASDPARAAVSMLPC
jgi:hypothetical protein